MRVKVIKSFKPLFTALIAFLFLNACNNVQPPDKKKKTEKDPVAFYKERDMSVPADILTPDKVETSIGILNYDDGRPTDETIKKAYRFLDVSRSATAYLNNLSAIATEVLKIAFEGIGATEAHHVLISEQLIDAHQVWPTGNTGTVYVFGFFDLKKTGPLVIEMPGKAGPGFVDDGWMR